MSRGSSRNLRCAAPHRSAHAPPACVQTHGRSTFFFPFPPSLFVVMANLSFLPRLLLPFCFSSFAARGVGGRGTAWRAFLKCPGAAATVNRRLKQAGSPRRCRRPRHGSSLALPGRASLRSLVSWPRPLARRVSPQLRRLGHCSWLLAELWKPPRLNAAPADVTAGGDQSAPRGPSVNHPASPGRGECGETAFRASVAAAPAAARGAGGRRRAARCLGPLLFR